MRRLILALAVPTLALAGCGEKETTANTAAVDQAVSAEDFATNDVTAIDAATGADANMAADVDFNLIDNAEVDGDGGGNATTSRTTPRARPRPSPSSTNNASDAPAPEPVAPPVESNDN